MPPPLNSGKKYFSVNIIKFGHFVNFSYIFSGKNISPQSWLSSYAYATKLYLSSGRSRILTIHSSDRGHLRRVGSGKGAEAIRPNFNIFCINCANVFTRFSQFYISSSNIYRNRGAFVRLHTGSASVVGHAITSECVNFFFRTFNANIYLYLSVFHVHFTAVTQGSAPRFIE